MRKFVLQLKCKYSKTALNIECSQHHSEATHSEGTTACSAAHNREAKLRSQPEHTGSIRLCCLAQLPALMSCWHLIICMEIVGTMRKLLCGGTAACAGAEFKVLLCLLQI